MRLLLLTILAASGLRAASCGSLTLNPITGLLDCVGTGGGGGSPGGATNTIQKNGGGGNFAASSCTDDATTVTCTEPIKTPSISTGTTPPAASVCTAGTAGMDCSLEGTTPTGTLSGVDVFWADNITHRWQMINNGTAKQPVVAGVDINISDQVTATHLASALPVNQGGTNCSSPTITCFNNITGFTAAGATGTTSGNLVFSISPALTGTPTTPTPSQNDNSTKVATTAYTDLAVANGLAGVNPAVAVLAASTANLTGTYANGASGVGATFTVTATGTFSLDGVAINTIGQRVLLKDQSTGFQNGVYTATVVGAIAVSPVFTRALDYNSPSDINSTGAIPVQSGTVNTTTSWLLTSTVTTIGTDALTYVRFSSNPANLVSAVSPGAGVAHFAGGTQTVTSSAVALTDMATQAANTSVANVTGGTAAPTASPLPAGGTNGCSGATDIPLYTAGTGWSCTQRTGTFSPTDETTFWQRSDFCFPFTVSGTGPIGWNSFAISGGTSSKMASATWPEFCGTILSGTASGSTGWMFSSNDTPGIANYNYPILTANTGWTLKIRFALTQTTNTSFYAGFAHTMGTNTAAPTNSFGIRYDTVAGDTALTFYSATGSTTTLAYSGVDTSAHTVTVTMPVAGELHFKVDSGSEYCITSSGSTPGCAGGNATSANVYTAAGFDSFIRFLSTSTTTSTMTLYNWYFSAPGLSR